MDKILNDENHTAQAGMLRQAVAVALVAAKRRRLQQVQAAAAVNAAVAGVCGSSAGSGIANAGQQETAVRWQERAQHLETEVRRIRSAAAALMAAMALTPDTANVRPPYGDDERTSSLSNAGRSSSDGGGGQTQRASSCKRNSSAQAMMQALLLPLLQPSPQLAPPSVFALESGAAIAAAADSSTITAAGILSLEREQGMLHRAEAQCASISDAGPATAASGVAQATLPSRPGSCCTDAVMSVAASYSAAKTKAAALSRVLVSVQALAELSAAAVASGNGNDGGHGGGKDGGGGSGSAGSGAIGTSPAVLHASALRLAGTQPHHAVLHFMEAVLVGSGGGIGGAVVASATLTQDVRRAYLRHAVQLLAAVVHSLAAVAAASAAAAVPTLVAPGPEAEKHPPAGFREPPGGVQPGGATNITAAACAARKELLNVVYDISKAVDRLLTVATADGSGSGGGASAVAAVQALGEMLAVPSLGQHVLVCAAEKIRDLGQILSTVVQAEAQSMLTRQAAAAAAFNRSRPVFDILAECSSRLPSWCSLVTAAPKPTDIGPDYLASHVQALLVAHALADSNTNPKSSNLNQLQKMTNLPAVTSRRYLFPLYGIAVRECLAATAAALMAVASGGAEFAGCALLAHCRALCASIKQSALLPR